jgi:hypothetical protein
VPVSRLREGAERCEPAPLQVIPRHEWPGRIILGVGCFTSLWCVVGMILLRLG